MFDARSILDALMRGGAQPQGQQPNLDSVRDLLGQLAGKGAAPSAAGTAASPAGQGTAHSPGDAGSLEDMLRSILSGGGQGGGGGLNEILGKLQQQAGQSGGGLGDILRQVFGQATSGVREGAGRIDEATGASTSLRDILAQATGRSPDEVMAQLKQIIANNPLAAGGALGGLGAIILGTQTGRSLATGAAKLGALALIGGLAYKAYQNYQQGKPATIGQTQLMAPPAGSGFEPSAITNEAATRYVRTMIAATAADGRIDPSEQKKLIGALQSAGLGQHAQEFLMQQLQHPATVAELADGVTSPQEALQVYASALMAVDVDSAPEHAFLQQLAQRLGIPPDLARHIEATAKSAVA